jgi:hypothetical protein
VPLRAGSGSRYGVNWPLECSTKVVEKQWFLDPLNWTYTVLCWSYLLIQTIEAGYINSCHRTHKRHAHVNLSRDLRTVDYRLIAPRTRCKPTFYWSSALVYASHTDTAAFKLELRLPSVELESYRGWYRQRIRLAWYALPMPKNADGSRRTKEAGCMWGIWSFCDKKRQCGERGRATSYKK